MQEYTAADDTILSIIFRTIHWKCTHLLFCGLDCFLSSYTDHQFSESAFIQLHLLVRSKFIFEYSPFPDVTVSRNLYRFAVYSHTVHVI